MDIAVFDYRVLAINALAYEEMKRKKNWNMKKKIKQPDAAGHTHLNKWTLNWK